MDRLTIYEPPKLDPYDYCDSLQADADVPHHEGIHTLEDIIPYAAGVRARITVAT